MAYLLLFSTLALNLGISLAGKNLFLVPLTSDPDTVTNEQKLDLLERRLLQADHLEYGVAAGIQMAPRSLNLVARKERSVSGDSAPAARQRLNPKFQSRKRRMLDGTEPPLGWIMY